MSDTAPPAPTPDPSPAHPAAAPDAPPPKKKVRLIRWKTLIVLVVLVAAAILVVPLVIEPKVRAMLEAALKDRGLELAPDSKLSISLLGARVHGENIKLLDATQPSKPVAATASTITADLAVRDSLANMDVIINDLTIDGMSGSLRRRSDGSPPGSKPEPGQPSSGIDWAKWYQKAMEQYKQRAEKKKEEKEAQKKKDEEEQKKPPEQRAKVPPHPTQEDPAWPKATLYRPLRREGRTYPRVLVRHLSISGNKVDMPDPSPFDVASFKLTGENVALDQDAGETMKLNGEIKTGGAGPATLALDRTPDNGGVGHLNLSIESLPLSVLNDPRIAGEEYAKYGASGDAKVELAQAWTGWDLTGTMRSLVTKLKLDPKPDAGGQAMQVAQYVNALKGQPIDWPVKIGGQLFAPTITDTGVKEVLSGSALKVAQGVATDKAKEEAGKLLDQQTQKNPQLNDAKDKLKGLFPGKK